MINNSIISKINDLFDEPQKKELSNYIKSLHPADIATLFDFVDQENWKKIVSCLSTEVFAEVMANLDENQVEKIGNVLNTKRLIEIVDELETDDATDVLAELPHVKSVAVLDKLEDKSNIEILLSYPSDSAGGIMQSELCHIEEGSRVEDAIEAIRLIRTELDDILDVYVVDDIGRLRGTVSLEDLLLTDAPTPVSRISKPIEHHITPDVDQEEVAFLFKKYNLASLPVTDNEFILLGRITFDDIHDVLEEEATKDVMVMAGVSKEELVYSSAIFKIATVRLPWLITSLLGGLIVTQLIPKFAHISKTQTIILTSFVPVLMAMTGNIGSQSAMIVTRGFAIGKIAFNNLDKTLIRELFISIIMGSTSAFIIGFFGLIVENNSLLGITLAISMFSSMIIASLIGVLTPALFKKVGIDPAIAAGPLVTTTCDIIGVLIYLVVAFYILSSKTF